MKKNHTSKQYSQCIILFCLAPDENAKIPLNFKDSLKGLKQKWSQSQNDPTCARFKVIYLSPRDTPDMEKFAPLKMVDRQSRIYVYGHARPGEDGFRSDAHAYCDENYFNKKNKFHAVKFTYEKVAEILLQNIINPEVRIKRIDSAAHYLLQAKLRKLKICLIACSTNLNEKNLKGDVIQTSLGQKFFDYLINHDEKHALLCDLVTANASVFPRPYQPNNHFKEFLKTFFNYYQTPANNNQINFHKRYTRRLYIGGNWEFNPLKLFPRHHYTDHYKTMYVISFSKLQNLINKNLSYIKLNIPQAEEYFESQKTGEEALNLLNTILNCKSAKYESLANNLRQAILNPNLSQQEFCKIVKCLENEWNQSVEEPARYLRRKQN